MRHNLCWYHEFPLRCYEVTLFTAFWCLLLYFSDIFRFINWCRTTWDALDEAVPHQTLRNPETCVVFTGVARMCCTKGGNVLFWQNVFAIRACNHVDWDPIQNYNLSNMQSINPDRRIRAPKPDRLDTHNLCSRLKLDYWQFDAGKAWRSFEIRVARRLWSGRTTKIWNGTHLGGAHCHFEFAWTFPWVPAGSRPLVKENLGAWCQSDHSIMKQST